MWKVGDALPAFVKASVVPLLRRLASRRRADCEAQREFLPVASAVVSMSAFSSRASVAAKKAAQELEILFTLESVE